MSLGEFLNQSQEAITAIKIIVYSLFVYLGIDGDVVQVLFILMLVDTILGATKAVMLGKLFSFKKLLWGMVTKLSVLIIPMVIALVAKGLSFNFKWFVLATLNILIVAEGFSAISNILSIKSKRNIENVDFISMLLKSIRNGLSSIVYRLLDGIEAGIDPDKKEERQEEFVENEDENDTDKL